MDKFGSIIVAVDFTPSSASALAQAIRIAQWNRAKLHAVHVIETLVAMEFQEVLTPYVQEIEDGLLAEARAAWASFAPGLPGKEGLDFDIAINNPLVEITRRVRDRRADLLVLGTGTSHGSAAGILATQCVRKVPTRVLLVRDPHTGPYKNVLACVDFSETSRQALDDAFRIAAQDSAAVHVLHVYQSPWKRLRDSAARPEFTAKYREAMLEKLTAFCTPARPDVTWIKPRFDIAEASSHGAGITDYVRANGCDLVVLGTRGHTNLRDVLMGSTAERVVRDAPCSILAIKPAEAMTN